MELAVDKASIGLFCHPASTDTSTLRQFTWVQVWKGSSALLRARAEGRQRPCSDSWAWPPAKAGSTRSQDFGDTSWILGCLSRVRVAGVSVLCSPCLAAARGAGLKAGRVFVVSRRTTWWVTAPPATQISVSTNSSYSCSCESIVSLI